MKKIISLVLTLTIILTVISFAGCSLNSKKGIDYLALVNKLHKLPDDWEDKLETITITNSLGYEVEVEKKAYDAYLKLKADLEKDGIKIDLDSARRSIEAQQDIVKSFTEKYGSAYVEKYVAVPGYSEHHTGLALDLYLNIDGKDVYYNEDMVKYPEIWDGIHEKLADQGFILRYLNDKEHITGYSYELWHIRYIDDVKIAKEISSKGLTLEEYLGAYVAPEVKLDYGKSDIYTKDQMADLISQIKCKFAEWEGCELRSIKYAGDKCNSKENLEWMNSLSKDSKYISVAEFLMEFHTPKDGYGSFNPDQDYIDFQWWLASDEDDNWDIVTYGY